MLSLGVLLRSGQHRQHADQQCRATVPLDLLLQGGDQMDDHFDLRSGGQFLYVLFRKVDGGEICVQVPELRVLVYDPQDGSSNIAVTVSIGTIFGIYRTVDWDLRGRIEDILQPGRNMIAAGYVLYGASTMLVYSTGQGVHGFTLNPELGEFLLSHTKMRLPEQPAYYSVNSSYYPGWSPGVQKYLRWLQVQEGDDPRLSSRYIGSLVADFHRNLLRGGVFCYPAELEKPQGKLRLLYEAAQLAFLVEQAGCYATDWRRPILDIVPETIHQRTPLYIGNRSLVERIEDFLKEQPSLSVD